MSDMSCVGVAVWYPQSSIILQFKCPPLSTVYTGEATGILEALNFINSHNLDKAVIFSDSLSCLQALLSNPFRSKSCHPLILRIRVVLLNCLNKGLHIEITYIPGHTGIGGNEMADSLAKSATQVGCNTHFSNYSQDLVPLSKLRLDGKWLNLWQESSRTKAAPS
ncbi:ribonuclease H1-like isoform X2 [Colias croceus]|uniref:ribonuclease H1-like isoform X2 n=1 Tax=Colias crocea TaxID=72248 RepID=UPI001E27EC03|nr:ribonuclease H1-like isoform X2 [Colias croceus]